MRISELVKGMKYREITNFQDVEIASIEYDSRKISPGALFVAIKGERFDGHTFIPAARKNGALCVIAEKKVDTDLPQVIVDDSRDALWFVARRFYKETEKLNKIGITGTNGKTTTAFLIHSILNSVSRRAGLIGTIYYIGRDKIKAERTTPESLDIFKIIEKFRKEGMEDVVMEVSSHALALKRVAGLEFRVAIFTNLSQDHLDFHRTMDEYKNSKLKIFSLLSKDGIALVNCDDPIYNEIARMNMRKIITYGMNKGATVSGEVLEDSIDGMKLKIDYQGNSFIVSSKLIGRFNAYNILASFATGVALGLSTTAVIKGIESLVGVKGRMEQVENGIFVDYAHTPDALQNVLLSLRRYPHKRLIVVFGCGGERDWDKRPKMGKIASDLADFVILTSDNPRGEEPERIIEDIKRGITNRNYKVILDRKAAIEYGIGFKEDGDILLIAGKGHEEYQILKDRKIPFDDAQIVRDCVKRAGYV
ncbi:MAG: UDP-N-acetylmuramoyl-L-alanyl-D-glutamate--2,6-diaminopimelate ligase [candidate division WOR-3 bacterium]